MRKKIGAILLATCMTTSLVATAGCGSEGEKVDPTRTQLYVNVRNCGIGTEFIYNLKAAYEAKNADAQIIVSTDDTLDDEGLLALKSTDDVDIIFAPNFILNDFVSLKNQTSDVFADITEVLSDGGESSILSKMYREEKQYHNVGTEENPKFFSLPWYTSYHGTVYDVDLFEEYGWDKGCDGYAGLDGIADNDDDLWGPDGIANTYDDGLPATWEDMKILMDEMSAANVTPFTWTSYKGYTPAWLSSIWANYEGADNFALLGKFEGNYVYSEDTKWLTGGTANAETGNKELAVTMENGSLMGVQNGKYAALKVAEYIISNNLYSSKAIGTTQNHYQAQNEYLQSVELSKTDKKVQRIAFLLEGNWWENEAKETFKDMEETYNKKYAYGTRRFGYFPWPKFIGSEGIPDQVNTNTTLMGGVVTNRVNACAVNKKTKNLELAKDFLKFIYSDEGNAIFTMSSGVLRPFDYTLTDEQLSTMTYYQQSLYRLSREESTQKVCGYSRTGSMYTAATYISGVCAYDATATDNSSFSDPFNAYVTSTGNNTVRTADVYMDFVERYIKSKTNFWK